MAASQKIYPGESVSRDSRDGENWTPKESADKSSSVGFSGKSGSQKKAYVNSTIFPSDRRYTITDPKKVFPFAPRLRARSFRALAHAIVQAQLEAINAIWLALAVGKDIEPSDLIILRAIATLNPKSPDRHPELSQWQAWARAELERLEGRP